jgi:uncharacterized membrane protein YbhN (UPF0104 family)
MAVASLGAAIALRRVAVDGRLGRAFAVFRELGRQPAALTSLAIATGTALATKVAAAAAIAAAVGVDRPLLAGLLVVPAVELAAALPLTPGNVGVASAAITFALGASGVPGATALAVGIAYGALEPLVAIAVGAVGGLVLFGGRLVPSLRVAAATAGALGFVGLLGAVVILPL